ncbi:MAG: hypothetical protein WA790_19100 [Sulfitobacter sp.]
MTYTPAFAKLSPLNTQGPEKSEGGVRAGLPFLRCSMAAGAVIVSMAGSASAQSLFSLDVTVDGVTESRSYDTIEPLLDALESSEDIANINLNYDDTTPGVALANIRGIDLRVTYPDTGATVRLELPSLGISEQFDSAATRAENEDAMVAFLKSNGDNILTRLQQSLVATTATDPVAGNPASLQSRMIASDFGAGTGLADIGNSQADGSTSDDKPSNLFGFGARLGRYTANGVTQNVIELPLSYTIPLKDPRYGVVLDAPITYIETAGTDTFSFSLGAGLRVPVYDNWTITPSLRVGATGSVDLGSVGVLYSAAVTSSFRWSMQNLDWELGNMVGYTQTSGAIGADDLEIDYDLQNTVMRNGISISKPTSRRIFGDKTTWKLSVVNTQIFGDEVFIDNYTDVAFSFGTVASKNGLNWDSVRLGLTYTFANEDYDGFRLNLGYQF